MGVLSFAKEDGLNPKKVASTKGGEYHSPCPGCGGKDRFIIWDKLNRYFCRQCRKSGDGVQYNRDFHGLSYVEACQKSGIIPRERTANRHEKTIFQFEPQIAQTPSSEWKRQAESFILYCQERLRKDRFALDLLFKRGFSQEFIEQSHLGWNPSSLWLQRSDWGLALEEKKLWIPKGLLIPTRNFSTGEPLKLKIRRSDWHEGDKLPKYVEISGSMQGPGVYGSPEDKPIIVVESELDAMLLQQYAADLCCSIALGGASKRPNVECHRLLLKAPMIFFSLDVDAAGAIAYRWWSQIYPHMKLWLPPVGKSPGDAYLSGIDLRKWMSWVMLQHHALH
jgi:DNA primase